MYALHGYINVMNKNIFIARNFFIFFPRCYFHIFIIYDCSWQEKKEKHTHTYACFSKMFSLFGKIPYGIEMD